MAGSSPNFASGRYAPYRARVLGGDDVEHEAVRIAVLALDVRIGARARNLADMFAAGRRQRRGGFFHVVDQKADMVEPGFALRMALRVHDREAHDSVRQRDREFALEYALQSETLFVKCLGRLQVVRVERDMS